MTVNKGPIEAGIIKEIDGKLSVRNKGKMRVSEIEKIIGAVEAKKEGSLEGSINLIVSKTMEFSTQPQRHRLTK